MCVCVCARACVCVCVRMSVCECLCVPARARESERSERRQPEREREREGFVCARAACTQGGARLRCDLAVVWTSTVVGCGAERLRVQVSLCCAPSSFYSARAPTPSPKTHDPEPITPGKLCKQDGVHWLLVATGVKVACVHGLAQTAGRNVLAEHAARRSGKRPPQTPARAGRKCTVQALRGHQHSAKIAQQARRASAEGPCGVRDQLAVRSRFAFRC